ncbi:hypothetical protein ACFPZ0_12895 [Streptomonospora nanhaiensis]|uniref:Uncharacterized protein n=1 Tax=Streptomonospora nanhaiensis TaxID=1323731 RepID=A0A853BS90_9ACTN|nr:hypothetical protein [Streptomonospora nanhaiensis]MBV2362637.1 hypothetical protein [Streptomonospora nanhaiensis]MBX9387273.1 hypothetical protein [Streptomonospora nanhaiensis]NYI98013.1 hypothetical protein [Streptomonospora nanhaiensis]
MSILLILLGAALVAIAVFNRVPRFQPAWSPQLVPARLTEAGRATLTTVGGSALIIAFFLALSGV